MITIDRKETKKKSKLLIFYTKNNNIPIIIIVLILFLNQLQHFSLLHLHIVIRTFARLKKTYAN